ncbi:MAG TPA: hypothetical protein VGG68_00045 [Caulobacteraceae bacterium]|jgi:hypothetical protein
MAQDLGAFTNAWMSNPYMFEPGQQSNQFSNYNNAPIPWPPSYNVGNVGAPTNAMGQPIQSYLDWAKANPAGMTINNTPQQPQQQAALRSPQYQGYPALQAGLLTPQQQGLYNSATEAENAGAAAAAQGSGFGSRQGAGTPGQSQVDFGLGQMYRNMAAQAGGPTGTPAAAPQAAGPPNNWMAALNARANPGNPVTPGATVPMVQGYQPGGGVNQAFLQQAGAGAGMNQNFLNNLRAIQGR